MTEHNRGRPTRKRNGSGEDDVEGKYQPYRRVRRERATSAWSYRRQSPKRPQGASGPKLYVFAPAPQRRSRASRYLRVGALLLLIGVVGEVLRTLEETPALVERVGAWLGVDLDLRGAARPRSIDVETPGSAASIDDPAEALRPGTLYLDTRPWGWAYVDGSFLGSTPLSGVELSGGYHTLRVEREGYRGYSTAVTIEAGRTLLIDDVILLRPVEGS